MPYWTSGQQYEVTAYRSHPIGCIGGTNSCIGQHLSGVWQLVQHRWGLESGVRNLNS